MIRTMEMGMQQILTLGCKSGEARTQLHMVSILAPLTVQIAATQAAANSTDKAKPAAMPGKPCHPNPVG